MCSAIRVAKYQHQLGLRDIKLGVRFYIRWKEQVTLRISYWFFSTQRLFLWTTMSVRMSHWVLRRLPLTAILFCTIYIPQYIFSSKWPVFGNSVFFACSYSYGVPWGTRCREGSPDSTPNQRQDCLLIRS